MNNKLLLIGVLFLAGFIYVCLNKTSDLLEGFSVPSNCPNLLIKKDDKYLLVNTTKSHIPGVNPIEFKNLEDYTEFMQWLRGQGIRCPVLFLQQTYDTQGKRTYRILPDAYEPNAGLPPQRMPHETKLYDAGHNPGSMPGFDPLNQYIGDYTPLDKMFHEKGPISDNPMDPNWGGKAYTAEIVKEGKYAGDTVEIKVA